MHIKEQLAAALREHQPPTHVDPQGLPRDEFDCCVEAVLRVVDAQMHVRCADKDCVRRGKHPQLSVKHLWRHKPVPPRGRGIFGSTCFTCGQYSWRRIHSGSR